ncbi:YceD family protein [Mycetohabitans endofungorum]|uniref:YceD family protein n=1 Tax=Mycetohabitans endofungorum TaxID=417203 RepID=UPI0030D3D66F
MTREEVQVAESTDKRSASTGREAALNLHALDLFEFARTGRQAMGQFDVGELARLAAEVPADAVTLGDYDPALRWHAQGGSVRELQPDGAVLDEPCLRVVVHGAIWLQCQRCMEPFRVPLDIDAEYRIVESDDEADERALDDTSFDVIVGSRQFDFVELIEEELLLSLPLVPKHEVCTQIHESLVTGAAGEHARDPDAEAGESLAGDEVQREHPFAALEALKGGGPKSGPTH